MRASMTVISMIIYFYVHYPYTKKIFALEMPGIEPGAFHMQSERATTALHPLSYYCKNIYSCAIAMH